MCTCSCLFYLLESLLPATRFLELTDMTFDHAVLMRCKLCCFFFSCESEKLLFSEIKSIIYEQENAHILMSTLWH